MRRLQTMNWEVIWMGSFATIIVLGFLGSPAHSSVIFGLPLEKAWMPGCAQLRLVPSLTALGLTFTAIVAKPIRCYISWVLAFMTVLGTLLMAIAAGPAGLLQSGEPVAAPEIIIILLAFGALPVARSLEAGSRAQDRVEALETELLKTAASKSFIRDKIVVASGSAHTVNQPRRELGTVLEQRPGILPVAEGPRKSASNASALAGKSSSFKPPRASSSLSSIQASQPSNGLILQPKTVTPEAHPQDEDGDKVMPLAKIFPAGDKGGRRVVLAESSDEMSKKLSEKLNGMGINIDLEQMRKTKSLGAHSSRRLQRSQSLEVSKRLSMPSGASPHHRGTRNPAWAEAVDYGPMVGPQRSVSDIPLRMRAIGTHKSQDSEVGGHVSRLISVESAFQSEVPPQRESSGSGSGPKGLQMVQSMSSLAYSDMSHKSSIGSSRHEIMNRGPATIEMEEKETQTFWRAAMPTVDAQTETALVWEEDGFRCKNCAKPPLLPGSGSIKAQAAIAPFRGRSRSRSRSQSPSPGLISRVPSLDSHDPNGRSGRRAGVPPSGSFVSRTKEFDGTWVVSVDSQDKVSNWARWLFLEGGRGRDASGRALELTLNENSEIELWKGAVIVEGDQLIRVGKSGVRLIYDRRRGGPSSSATSLFSGAPVK